MTDYWLCWNICVIVSLLVAVEYNTIIYYFHAMLAGLCAPCENSLNPLVGRRFLANVNSRSRSLYAVARPSVCRLSSVTLVHPTQAVQIFRNISTAFGTLAIR